LPKLKERAVAAEEQRRLPAESIADLREAGLFRIAVPARYGGLCDDLDLMYDVAWELGRACGSTAWCYSVWAIHSWIVGHFPERAQEDYFADGPDVLCSSSLSAGSSVVRPATGGFRLSGRWRFSSGSHASTWAVLGAAFPEGLRWVLLPRADYKIVDTWFASGLAATDSNDIVAEEVFVPEYRTLEVDRAGDSDLHGWEMHGRPSYRAPVRTVLGWDLVSPLIGMAQGMVDRFAERAAAGAGASAASTQMRFGEASAKVHTARVLFRHTMDAILAKAARGDAFSRTERAQLLRDKALVAKLCIEAVDQLFEVSGGSALLHSEPLQRLYRDAHAASHHASMQWDVLFESFGRLALSPTD
jgi:3-hydroxy-9,10-secoandrosta-1,3,5(10)-triene-9,17-dione monooxygenase